MTSIFRNAGGEVKLAYLIGLLILASATAARAAEDFAFTATGHDGGRAWVRIDGQNIGATYSTVSSIGIGPDGATQTSNGACQSWTPDPNGPYSFETVCNYKNDQGTYATLSLCTKDMSKGCSGKLVGVSGAYANRAGTFSVQTKPGADDGTDSYSGSGHWD
jgi:hypothetical protein